ncbi:heme ABC exporter ATP-binding protein CcmA [Devosia sp.]|uniref:heme ABC exporter ATP-binding protein CcmA n=1 Tax=Devosia sp. TaxID=1871048 RepID=UPI002AFE92AA|nr:heme ABC exporter ATP-binding protein CcmA [Devosia sp.]
MTQRQVLDPLTLSAQDLVCGRGGMALGPPLSFSLSSGQCLFLRGPNGAGKTTLLLTLAGLITPLSGHFSILGAAEETGRLIHHCGHRNAIKPRLTVAENLQFWARINPSGGLDPALALAETGLARLADLDAGYLSAGQSRRLALARLLVSHRPIWLLDEPTAALDSQGHGVVASLIEHHLGMGGLVLAATHDPINVENAAILTLGGQG